MLFLRKFLIIAIVLLISNNLYAQITSTFNANAQGWTTPNDADATIGYSATGGNPNGMVFGSPFSFNLGAGTIYVPFNFVAPAAYLGNRSAYYNGTLRYDIQQSTTGTPNQYAEVTIADNSGITLYYFPTTPNQPAAAPAWTTYSAVFNNASGFWKTTNSATGPLAAETQIQSILSDLATLQIRGLYRDANTTNRLDNVIFTPPIIINTQPPANTSVCAGTPVTLATAASGNPAIAYQWQIIILGVYTNLSNGGNYSGVTTNTLSINTTDGTATGNYRCTISGTNVVNANTNNATVIISTIPVAPTTTGAASCTPAALTLTASGLINGQYRWYTTAVGGPIQSTASTYLTPLLSLTTTYYVSIFDGACESTRTPVIATINTPPGAPTSTSAARCGTGTVTLSAAGGTAGQYRWYTVPTGGAAIVGQTNATYLTPSLTITTTFHVAINNGTCESTRTAVVATINTPPTAPTVTGAARCGTGTVTLTATGGTAGQYRWYTVPTGGAAIAGQTNATYVTPSLTITTTFHVAINNGTCESTRTAVVATINTPPTAPTTTGAAACGTSTVTLTATGGAAGQYRWYTVPTGGTAIAGQTNATYVTPSLTITTTFHVAINNGTCESTRTAVVATINTPPTAPTTTGASTCLPGSVTLSASGGSAGQYRWYTAPTGGTAIAGQTNATYSTPSLPLTTTYYVSINNGTCESARTSVIATVAAPGCDNEPPVIQAVPVTTQIGGIVTVNLVALISDSDNNVDFSTLSIVTQPSSGASASIDGNFNLILNYNGLSFLGIETITLRVCDTFVCTNQVFSIEVVGDIEIFTGISPNNDFKNETFLIQNIEELDATRQNRVSIYNRWGDMVWEGSNYDNQTVVFKGKSKNNDDLPSGTYFYKIEFSSLRETQTGYLMLKQ